MPLLWGGLQLLGIVLRRVGLSALARSSDSVTSTVVLNLALTPPCLTCLRSATATFLPPLMDPQALVGGDLGPTAAASSQDPVSLFVSILVVTVLSILTF